MPEPMDDPRTSFDGRRADQARDSGMEQARLPVNREQLLETARDAARAIWHGRATASSDGNRTATVNADDVQRALIRMGYHPRDLGNAAGSIFKTSEWEPVGYTKSKRVSNHSRVIRTWRWAGDRR